MVCESCQSGDYAALHDIDLGTWEYASIISFEVAWKRISRPVVPAATTRQYIAWQSSQEKQPSRLITARTLADLGWEISTL